MDVNEAWAYRSRRTDPLVEVVVKSIGTKRPARVLVRFVAEEFEGREEWVPPARLKTPWVSVESFGRRESLWAAVLDASVIGETAAEYAASTVFEHLVPAELATDGYRTPGVAQILDVPGLAAFLGCPEEDLLSSPLSFQDEGRLVVPWATTELIVRRAAARDPDPVLRCVEKEEREFAREMVHGKTYRGRRGQPDTHISAEYYVDAADEPYYRPCWELLRSWCGGDAVERNDELAALRKEVARVAGLTLRAVDALRSAGRSREAEEIARELGIPGDEVGGR